MASRLKIGISVGCGTILLMMASIEGCETQPPVPVPSMRAAVQIPEVPAWWLPLALSWDRRMFA
jgi:hypothetical protein